MERRRYILAICSVTVALLFPVIVQACAVCLTGASENDPVANAFNWSVLYLLTTPYAIVGSIGGWLFYRFKSAARRRSEEKNSPVLN